MSVIKFKQIAAGRKGGAKDGADRNYVVTWVVIVDDRRDGPLTIGNYHPGGAPKDNVPLRFQPYVGYENNDDGGALCRDVQVEQDGDEWQKWKVTATFSAETSNPSTTPDPEEDPVNFWIETEFGEVETTKTWDDEDIKNSAGQLIAGLRKPNYGETWVWEKNYTSLNRGVWKAHQNTTNSSDFYEIEAKQGLLHIIVPKPAFRGGVMFWRVQFRVTIRKDKWTVNPADRGTAVKNEDGKLEQPVDPNTGQKIDGEVYLKEDGSLLFEPDEDEIRYIGEKDLVEPKDFSALGFDS